MSGKIIVKNRRPFKFWHLDGRVMELPCSVLSTDAKLYYGYLCSRPDGWVYSRSAVIKFLGSKHKADKCNQELKKTGLITVIYGRGDRGRFAPKQWTIESFEDSNLNDDGTLKDPNFDPHAKKKAGGEGTAPEPESPSPVLPDTDLPLTVSPSPEKPDTVKPSTVGRDTVKQEPLKEKILEEKILEINSLEENKKEKASVCVLIDGNSYEVPKDRKVRVGNSGKYRTWHLPQHNPQGFINFLTAYPLQIPDMKAFADKHWDKHKLSDDDIRESIADFPNRQADAWKSGKIHHPRTYLENTMWENPAPVIFSQASPFEQSTDGVTINVAAEPVETGQTDTAMSLFAPPQERPKRSMRDIFGDLPGVNYDAFEERRP